MSKLRAALIGFGLGIALVAGTAATVLAADKGGPRRVEADIVAPTSKSWSGPWIGAHVGYAIQTANLTGTVQDPANFALATDGVAYGIGAGFDLEVQKTYVVGIFADFSKTNASQAFTVGNDTVGDLKINNMTTMGVRAGYLITPHVLGYALAGYTWTDIDFKMPLVAQFKAPSDANGLTLGGGIEVMANAGWSLKLEYRWTDMGSDLLSSGVDPLSRVENDLHQVLLGVSYRF